LHRNGLHTKFPTLSGFRRAHIQAYLDEFVFRWNRRRHYRSSFDMLLGIGLRTAPMDYWTLIGRTSPNHMSFSS
jgi:hypothetical protein